MKSQKERAREIATMLREAAEQRSRVLTHQSSTPAGTLSTIRDTQADTLAELAEIVADLCGDVKLAAHGFPVRMFE